MVEALEYPLPKSILFGILSFYKQLVLVHGYPAPRSILDGIIFIFDKQLVLAHGYPALKSILDGIILDGGVYKG